MADRKLAQQSVENHAVKYLAVKYLGVVLAGGKSSRMGTDKAQLPFRSGSLLDFQIEKLKLAVGAENVIVSGFYPQFKHVVDVQANLGPLGGIISVIQKYPEVEYFLFTPVDMPKVELASLLYLLKSAMAEPEYDCWSFCNFEMPLVVRNHKSLIVVFEELLSLPRQMRSVQSLCAALKYCVVEVPDSSKNEFVNANTRDVWEKVRQ